MPVRFLITATGGALFASSAFYVGGTFSLAEAEASGAPVGAIYVPGDSQGDHFVRSDAELNAALASAKGGDRVLLGGGSYGTLRIVNRPFESAVSIVSADRANPAHFTDIKIAGSANIRISGIEVGRGLEEAEPIWTYISKIENNSNISINGVRFHGSMDGDPTNDGNLLFVRNVPNFSISNSTFEQANASLIVMNSSGVRVSYNRFAEQKLDAMEFASVQDVRIIGNHITGHRPTGPVDHPDGIQFWTHGTTAPSKNILIANNVILQGDGKGSQGIFMRDELGTMPYQNVTIQNNFIYNNDGYWHGISIEHVNGLSVTRNTVVSSNTDAIQNRIFIKKGNDVDLSYNVADLITLDHVSNLQNHGNIDLKSNPGALSLLPNINLGSILQPSDLAIARAGYRASLEQSSIE